MKIKLHFIDFQTHKTLAFDELPEVEILKVLEFQGEYFGIHHYPKDDCRLHEFEYCITHLKSGYLLRREIGGDTITEAEKAFFKFILTVKDKLAEKVKECGVLNENLVIQKDLFA